MSRRKKNPLPFDKRGGLVTSRRQMLESAAYMALSVHAKQLITLLQIHWRNEKSVDYGTREAAQKIPCDRKTAMKAFDQLMNKGFIVCIEQSLFNSRTGSATRSWRLTWMPYNSKPPTNEWEKWHE